MSHDLDNTMWRRVEEATAPSADDLARTERELAKTHAKALPIAMVERIVDEATTLLASRAMPARPRQARLLLGAAAGLLCVFSLGWVGAKVIWPRQLAPESVTLDSDEVIDTLHAPESDRTQWRGAFIAQYRETRDAFQVLTKLQQDDDDEVATAAGRALSRLTHGGPSPAAVTRAEPKDATAAALDVRATPTSRCDAIACLENLIAAGVAAMNEAPTASPADARFKDGVLLKLRLLLYPDQAQR